MVMPKRVKRRKQFRGTMAGKALRGNKITNGEYGLVALEPASSPVLSEGKSGVVRYLSRFSLISQLQQSQLRLEWVLEREHLSIG